MNEWVSDLIRVTVEIQLFCTVYHVFLLTFLDKLKEIKKEKEKQNEYTKRTKIKKWDNDEWVTFSFTLKTNFHNRIFNARVSFNFDAVDFSQSAMFFSFWSP